MIKNTQIKKYTINLDGPQGNSFFIMGEAKKIMSQLKWSKEKQGEVIDLLTLSDYVNLIRTFDSFFGSFVDLETDNHDLLRKCNG